MCFTINSETSDFRSDHPGADNGLRLVLFNNQSDVLFAASPAAGFQVLLHDQSEIPAVRSLGFRVSPGKSTAVSFSFKNVSQLPAPYGDCRDESGYTLMGCLTKCCYNYSLARCNCTVDFYDESPMCNPAKVVDCVIKSVDSFVSTGESRKCDCPLHCNQRSYPYTVSYSPLSQHYLNRASKSPEFRRRSINISRLSRELAFVDIFYSKLTYVNIQTQPAYNALKLFADVGGALGLILGGTVLTVYEVFEFIFDLFVDTVLSFRFSRKLRSSRHPA